MSWNWRPLTAENATSKQWGRKYNKVPAGILTTETLQITMILSSVKCRVTTVEALEIVRRPAPIDSGTIWPVATAHQDVYAEITKECFGPPKEVGYCLFDKGDFCFLKMNLTKTVLAECYAANPVRNTRIICTPACKRAVISYVQNTGCCIDYWKRYSYSATTISNIFYVCNVQIPKPCTKLSPPAEFINCAHSKAAERAGLTSLVVIIAGGVALITAL